MEYSSDQDILFKSSAELVQLLTIASRSQSGAQSRKPLELMAMHTLPGRLRYATHFWTYMALSERARKSAGEAETARLFNQLRTARENIVRTMLGTRVCPATRQGALIECLVQRPVITREALAAAANVSTQTAGRWLKALEVHKIVTRKMAGNLSIYFVREFAAVIVAEHRVTVGQPADRKSIQQILDARVVIPMDPYHFRAWSIE